MERLGRLPEAGDTLVVDGAEITVERMKGRAVEWLVVTPAGAEDDDDA
jgi:CBS domain containing-hemolysin-like protein